MTYSLFDRIHGAFWGVMIAHQLTQPHRSTAAVLESLTQGVDWVCQLATGRQAETLAGALAIACADAIKPDWEYLLSPILPLLLYDADHPDNLNGHLQVLFTDPGLVTDGDVNHPDALPLGVQPVSQIMVSAIAHALQLSPLDLSLVDVLRSVWPVPESASPHPLTDLHIWLSSPTSLATVSHSLNAFAHLSPPIPDLLLALYCSLSSGSDPRLALLRASRSTADPRLTAWFTGVMIGASQGSTAFPTLWRSDRRLDHALHQLAARLLAIRAGVYVAPGAIAPALSGRIPMLAAPGIFHS